ncbi:RidA family protein [Chondromyces apiculatus]|nr:RidA family protein [Chondromyces apiculatus]
MPPAKGYSQVVVVPPGAALVYVSGQIGMRPDGTLEPGGFAAQVTRAFTNLAAALEAAGSNLAHIVKLTHYLTDVDAQLAEVRSIRDRFLDPTAPPASTAVEVSRLVIEGVLYEVDAVAFVLPGAPGGAG